jgi:hypothetical protein
LNLKTCIGRELFAALHSGRPEDGLPGAWERWSRLLNDKSPVVRLKAEELVAERVYGRTRQMEDGAGEKTIVEVRYVPNWRGLGKPAIHETIENE